MAYYGHPPDQAKVRVRSTRGETIDLAVPTDCTVGDLHDFLVGEFQYHPETKLTFDGVRANESQCVCSFPYGSLLIEVPPASQPVRWNHTPGACAAEVEEPRAKRNVARQIKQVSPHQQPATTQPACIPASAAGKVRATATSTPPRHNNNLLPAAGAPLQQPSRSEPVALVKPAFSTAKDPPRSFQRAPAPESRKVPVNSRATSAPTASATQPAAALNTSENPITNKLVQEPTPPPPPNITEDVPNSNESPHSSGSLRTPTAPSSRNAAGPSRPDVVGDEEDSQSPAKLLSVTMECHVPDVNKIVRLQICVDSSVDALLQAVAGVLPEIGPAAKVVYRGKVLPRSERTQLFNLGIRTDCRVFIASGEFASPDTVVLLEIEEDVQRIGQAIEHPLSEVEKKGYYEDLMRILFRTDGLQEVEGVWKQKRKDMVNRITALQDQLGIATH